MSLFSDYIKELKGFETIEKDGGFITYSFYEGFSFVHHLYIAPEKRGTDLMNELCLEVGKKTVARGFKYLKCFVDIDTEAASRNLLLYLKFGLKVTAIAGDQIELTIDITKR